MESEKRPERRRVFLIGYSKYIIDVSAQYLNLFPEIEVLGAVSDMAAAADAVKANMPDIVILDIRLTDKDDLAVFYKLRFMNPDIKFVLLAFIDGTSAQRVAHAIGADAIVSKYDITSSLFPVIKSLLGEV